MQKHVFQIFLIFISVVDFSRIFYDYLVDSVCRLVGWARIAFTCFSSSSCSAPISTFLFFSLSLSLSISLLHSIHIFVSRVFLFGTGVRVFVDFLPCHAVIALLFVHFGWISWTFHQVSEWKAKYTTCILSYLKKIIFRMEFIVSYFSKCAVSCVLSFCFPLGSERVSARAFSLSRIFIFVQWNHAVFCRWHCNLTGYSLSHFRLASSLFF